MLRPIPLFPGRGCARRSADLIRRSDFSDVAEVPEEFTENQLRDAHNDIVRRLRPGRVIASALVAALASPLFGGLVVETHAKGSWPNTSNVVTSVSWEGGTSMDTNSVRGVVDSSFAGGTNAVNAAVAAVGSMSNSWNRVAETVGSMSNSWNRAGSDATNYTDSATNALRLCDGAARPLPKYLHAIDFADSYPDAAQEYYRSRGNGKAEGGCSAVRDGGFLYRNFDYPFDDRAEFVVKMSAGPNRFASVGVAQVGTNLTEQMVTSGKPEYSNIYKWLPGATVDGINENGVVAEINVVDGDPQTSGWRTNATSEAIHPLAAVRWVLDHATNAQHAATYIAANIRFPQGWAQNFHYMVADATSTYIVENGAFVSAGAPYRYPSLTNCGVVKKVKIYPDIVRFTYDPQHPSDGEGVERLRTIIEGANITNVWYTNAYRRETNPPWVSDLKDVIAYTNAIFNAWAEHPKEYFRNQLNGGQPWWQSVHTSVYDIMNRVLRVAVQETDDWYTFQVPVTAPKIDAYTKAETDAKLAEKIGGGDVPSFEQDPTVGLTNGTIHIKGQAITPITGHQSLTNYFTKEQSSTNATAKANEVVSNRVDGLEYLTGGRTAGDTVRAYNELVAKLRGDTLPHGFRLYGATEDFATISNAISFAAAHLSGDVRIIALEDFRLDGTERWSLLGSRRVVLSGQNPDIVLYHTGPASLGFFSNAPRIEGVVSNLVVSATPGMRLANIHVASVKWKGWIDGSHITGNEFKSFKMTNVDIDANGGKYAVDFHNDVSSRTIFTDCTFSGFRKGAVDFVYNRGNATFTRCKFDASGVNRKDTVGIVNFQGGGGSPVFDRCEFVNLARTVDGVAVNGPAVADRVPDGSPQGTMTFSNCTFGDSVAYVIAYGDPYRDAAHPSNTSTRIHFNLSGDGNWWKDWDGASGTKMTGFGTRYTGVGYLGDAPAKGDVVETPWEGSAAQGTFGSLGRRTALAVARAASTVDTSVREPLKPGMVAAPQYAPLSEIEGTRSMLLNADELLRLKQDRRDMTNFYTKAKADAKLAEKIGGGEVPSFEQDPTVGLTNGTIHIKGQAITPLTSFTEQDPTATAKANAAIAAAGCYTSTNLPNTIATNSLSIRGDLGVYTNFVEHGAWAPSSPLDSKIISIKFVYDPTWSYDDGQWIGQITTAEGLFPLSFAYRGYEDSNEITYAGGWLFEMFGSPPEKFTRSNVVHNDKIGDLAVVSQIEAATNGLVSASNPVFADAVKSVAISWDISSVTNAVAALNDFKAAFGDLGAGDIVGGAGTLGGIIIALIGAVTWLKKNKVQTLKLNDGSIVKAAENGVIKVDDFFKESNTLLVGTIDGELPIPFASLPANNTTSSYKRFRVTVTDDMTLILHTPTSGDAEIFECRFDGSGLTADKSISFSTSGATATTMDTDCGTVKAGKIALMSAFWNGTTWDVNWKVEG